jgi:hypothetical protein
MRQYIRKYIGGVICQYFILHFSSWTLFEKHLQSITKYPLIEKPAQSPASKILKTLKIPSQRGGLFGIFALKI